MPFKVNFQKLRHNDVALQIRRIIYISLFGKKAYPLSFKRAGIVTNRSCSNIYVHIPFCKTICPHCPYNKISFKSDIYEEYKEALLKEISIYLDSLPDAYRIESLYFGGGTPSMTPELISMVIEKLRDYISKDVEIGIEVHPQDASIAFLNEIKGMGVNKISLGIETFKKDLLIKLGRFYSPEDALKSIKNAKIVGFDCVDVNLIYGISGQELEGLKEDVNKCVALKVDHISAYPLMTFIHTTMGMNVAKGRFNHFEDSKRIRMQKEIGRICLGNGYKRTSVWSFTINNKRPYTTVTRENYVGFGAGAGTKIDGVFQFNTFSIQEYIKIGYSKAAIQMESNDRFRRFHWFYWQLYNTHVDEIRYTLLFGRSIKSDFGLILSLFCLIGWCKRIKTGWSLTERGAIWSHRLQMLFSLTYIDRVWKECQQDPWPERIVLK